MKNEGRSKYESQWQWPTTTKARQWVMKETVRSPSIAVATTAATTRKINDEKWRDILPGIVRWMVDCWCCCPLEWPLTMHWSAAALSQLSSSRSAAELLLIEHHTHSGKKHGLAVSRYKTLDTEALLRISSFGSKPYSGYSYMYISLFNRSGYHPRRLLDSNMNNIYNHTSPIRPLMLSISGQASLCASLSLHYRRF